jgi:hypothetical protein
MPVVTVQSTRPPGRLWRVARVFRRGVDQALAKLA